MKRLLVTSAAVLAIALAATSCGVADDTVAATVNGHEISVASVSKLAKSKFVAQQAQQGSTALVSSPKGTTGSAKQRIALTFLVQATVYEEAVASRHASATAADRSTADAQLAAYEKSNGAFEASVKPVVQRLFLSQAVLTRVLKLDDPAVVATPEKIAAYYAAHQSEFGSKNCVDGFAVAEAQQAAAQAHIDRGDDLATILGDTALAAQGLSQDGKEVCVNSGQITEPTLAKLVGESPVGAWATAKVTDPQSGVLSVFIRPNSREQLTASSPDVVSEITSTLQQAAQSDATAALSKIIDKATKSAKVDIDPRYGKWDPKSPEPVVAPATPSDKQATTTVPVVSGQ